MTEATTPQDAFERLISYRMCLGDNSVQLKNVRVSAIQEDIEIVLKALERLKDD